MNLTQQTIQAYPFAQVLSTPKQKRHIASDNVVFLRPLFSMVGRAANKTAAQAANMPADFCRLIALDRPRVADGQLPIKEQEIMTALTILTTEIRQLDGLYSLNDLHNAAGGEEKHAPTNFIRLDQTRALITELCSAEMQIIPTKTIRGRGKQQGTYVCRELVYAYAMWISARFHLQVIRAFDAIHHQADRSAQLEDVRKEFERQYKRLKKHYNYPRNFLEQPYFKSANGSASLNISMLSNTEKFISPLFCLLNELRADGHEISAPWDEAIAMREAIVRANETLEHIYLKAIREANMPSKVALKTKSNK